MVGHSNAEPSVNDRQRSSAASTKVTTDTLVSSIGPEKKPCAI